MADFKQRIVEEKQQLDERLEKLEAFLHTGTFDGLEERQQELLTYQADLMGKYSDVLRERLELLG